VSQNGQVERETRHTMEP